MEVVNAVWPDEAQATAMSDPGPDGPIVMVNLLKFRERAEYRDGRDTKLSGREAYQLYGDAVAKILSNYGGRVLFAGDVTHLSLGHCEPLWDEVALVEYPSRGALRSMAISPEWIEASVHREAGLEGQLNIETTWFPGLREALAAGG
ncbi:MAG: DUF1330 domain-containing protein [Alphaproteobacteria bacterium]